jgi:hypothetical protein
VNGPDPTAPDLDGARERHPGWTFWREGEHWLARRKDGAAQLSGLSLESLEGKISRACRTPAGGPAEDGAAAGEEGIPAAPAAQPDESE